MSTPPPADASLRAAAEAYRRGDLPAALEETRHLLEADPGNAAAWNNLGVFLHRAGEPAAALEACLRALTLAPGYASALNNAGTLLREQGALDEAERYFAEALARDPGYADAASNLGTVCNQRGDYTGAVRHFLAALALDPDHADATGHLGAVLSPLRHPESEARLRRALSLRPEDPEKQLNLGLHLMRNGSFAEGWPLYEARWHMPRGELRLPHYEQPRWSGQSLEGATLLLHTEQGFGDTFHFVRCVPLLLARGARVVLHTHPALLALLGRFAEQYGERLQAVARHEAPPPFDFHAPLLSVPHLLGITPASVPSPVRLTPRATVQRRLPGGPMRVGVAWAGSPSHSRDFERSLQLAWLKPVFQVAGVEFVSLQVGPAAGQITTSGFCVQQPDVMTWLRTAELLDTLDLVIAVDTAVAHLAATQGVPTWLLLPLAADWRWQLTVPGSHPEPGSLWYSDVRIFQQQKMAGRQPQERAWQPVLERVAAALRAAVATG